MREAVNHLIDVVPPWVKAVVLLVGSLGFPIIVASVLLLQTLGIIPSKTALEARTYYTSRFDVLEGSLKTTLSNDAIFARRLTKALKILCENHASTPQQINNCALIE